MCRLNRSRRNSGRPPLRKDALVPDQTKPVPCHLQPLVPGRLFHGASAVGFAFGGLLKKVSVGGHTGAPAVFRPSSPVAIRRRRRAAPARPHPKSISAQADGSGTAPPTAPPEPLNPWLPKSLRPEP